MPKYTDEQIERAKNVDVRTFLEQTEGFSFSQSGKYLKCKNPERTGQPSSLAIDISMNRIFYNSVTGNRPLSALDWCKEVKNMDFQSAMSLVLGENPQGERVEKPKFKSFEPKEHTAEAEKKDFILPEKAENNRHVYSYLTATRGIPNHIVNSCIKNGLIMEDNRRNAVFVGYDDNNVAKYAARRGTFTPDGAEPFKRDVSGSDKNFAFKLLGKSTETIYVTEAAIDALSLAAIEDKFNGDWSFRNKTYLSTGGAGIDSAIEQFCKTHKVKTINICFDNDEAGKNGMEKVMQKFREMGYEVNDMRATLAHDYNDELIAFNKNPHFYPEPPATVKKNEPLETAEQDVSEQTSQEAQESPLKPLENETANNTNNNAKAAQTAQEAVTEPPNEERTENSMPEVNISDSKQKEEERRKAAEAEQEAENQQLNELAAKVKELGKVEISEEMYNSIIKNNPVSLAKSREEIVLGDQSWYATEQLDKVGEIILSHSSAKYGWGDKFVCYSPEKAAEIIDGEFKLTHEGAEFLKGFTEKEASLTNKAQKTAHKTEPNIEPLSSQFPRESEPSHHRSEVIAEDKENSRPIIPDIEKRLGECDVTGDTKGKANILLATLKDRQEHKRANLLDKIDGIDSKISARQAKIEKLQAKAADHQSAIKTMTAIKRFLGNSALGGMVDGLIERKQEKIRSINEEKIPKQEAKIGKQNKKRAKVTARLGKVNRKIEGIDKVQEFFSAIGSKDREVRHQGFVTGLENLSDYRRENLEAKVQKLEKKISGLSAKYNSAEISHREKLEIGDKIKTLRVRAGEMREQINGMNKLRNDLTDIKDGRFTSEQLDITVERTADKLSERLESGSAMNSKDIVGHIIEQSVEAGSEAIAETAEEHKLENAARTQPDREIERIPDDRQPNVTENLEQQILLAAAAITGIDISELNRLPAEIKAEIVTEFQENSGNISSEKLAEKICEIAEIEPPEAVKPTEPVKEETREEKKENPLREIEEMTEDSYDHIDGMLNNIPPEKPKEREAVKKDEPLFSRSKVMSDEFKPTSSKSAEEIERDKNKNKDKNIGL